jgi:hypothetical protein
MGRRYCARKGELCSNLRMSAAHRPQTTNQVLMVRPAAFGFNAQAALTNRFQSASPATIDAAVVARAEFDDLARALRGEGIRVCVVEDSAEPLKPDAVFPNNWVSFHDDGTVVLYPLQPANRRPERRREIIDAVGRDLGFIARAELDLTEHERQDQFLEGTGSLVLDHVARIAYACRSARTHEALVAKWCEARGYEAEIFDANDAAGAPYYHTNVMLSIGTRFAVICAESIAARDRQRVLARLRDGARELIEIDRAAVARFAANILELETWDEALGDMRLLVLSTTARAAFTSEQYARLSACVDSLLVVPVPTIERLGGGSVRCMLAEVFASA